MKLSGFLAAMERIAPRELALEFDNPGLLIEPDHEEIKSVLVALDCTPQVAREAEERNADLVLTHHPLFFHPVQKLLYREPETAAACLLLRHGIGHFAAHTNLDAALGGVNDTLCELFGVLDALPFERRRRPRRHAQAGGSAFAVCAAACPAHWERRRRS